MEHPFKPHDQDLVAVLVVHEDGCRDDGWQYKKGETLNMRRGHANAHAQGERPQVRILRTISYRNDPNPDAGFEQQPPAAADSIGYADNTLPA